MAAEILGVSKSVEPQSFTPDTLKALLSQFLGFFADAYDLTLVLNMSIILSAVFLPPDIPPLIKTFEIIFSYSLTIIARPLGSAIFGNLGDKIGRRTILLITVYSDFIFGGAIVFLPDFRQAGYLGFIIYSIIRFGLGIFLGGEYSVGHPFVMEWTPTKRRGMISGIVQGGFSLGSAFSAGMVFLFVNFFGLDAVIDYAWRYLFITLFIPLIPALIIRYMIRESPIFDLIKERHEIEKSPILSIFKKPVVFDFLQIMTVMTGLFFSSYVFFAYVPAILGNAPSIISGTTASSIFVIASLGAFSGAVFFGAISQRFGRKRTGMFIALAILISSIPLYYTLIYSASVGNVYLVAIASIMIGFITQGPWGLVPVYLAERFKASHRASGSGFGYSSGIFIGGWFSIYIPLMHNYLFKGIDGATNVWFSTAVLLIIGAILILIGFHRGPETKGTSLASE